MLILNKPEQSQNKIYNVGNPENEISIKKLADLMITIFRKLNSGDIQQVYEITKVTAENFYGPGYDDSDRRVPDITKIKNDLGWNPSTDLNSALRQTMSNYIKEYSTLKK